MSEEGLKDVEKTKSACPLNSTRASEVWASHRRRVLSSEAVERYRREGLHETSLMPRVCPVNVVGLSSVDDDADEDCLSLFSDIVLL